MKKILSAFLCLCMIVSLCSCAAQESAGGAQTPAASAPAETSAPDQTPLDDPSPEAFGASLGDRVIIRTVKTQDSFNAPDGSVILLFSYVTPTVLIEERQQAAAMINEQINLMDEAYISGAGNEPGKNQILEEALDNFSYVKEKDADLNTVFTAARTVESTRADGSAISFLYWTSIYTGGPSGSHGYMAVNFSSETGEKLTLDSLSDDPSVLKQALIENLLAVARDDKAFYAGLSEYKEDPDASLAAVVREGSWYFSSDGIVFFPAFGELKPDGEGLPTFTIPYSSLVGVLDPRYLPVKRGDNGTFDVVRLGDVTDGTVHSIDKLIVSDGDELYLKIDGTAYDVTISSFFYVHQAEGDERFHAKDRLWYASYMDDCALQIRTIVPNGMPNLMITYTDADYAAHRLFISQSGVDDGVALVDDTIEAVG